MAIYQILWRFFALQERFDELTDAAFATILRHHADAGDSLDLWHSISRTGSNSYCGEQVETVDVVTYIGYFIEGNTQLITDLLSGCHLTAIALALAEVVKLQLSGTVLHYMGVLTGDDTRLNTCLTKQLETHAVAGVELLLLVARLGIVHAAISQCAIDIAEEKLDLRLRPLELGEGVCTWNYSCMFCAWHTSTTVTIPSSRV